MTTHEGSERLVAVLREVADERTRQDMKWGEQNHPDFDPVLLGREGGCSAYRMSEEYEVPCEARAKFKCDTAFKRGEGTYAHILVEGVAEVVGACNAPPKVLREELVQVAAVAVAWIQAIDRRAAK